MFLDLTFCNLTWWHWLLGLLVPFLLGYLLRYYLNATYKAQITELQKDKASLEADLKKAKSMKTAAPVVANPDKTELNALKDKVRDLEVHNAQLKTDIKEALAVKQQFNGINLEALNRRITELEASENQLTSELSSQKSMNASLTANTGDLDALKKALADAQQEITRLTAQANTLKKERDGIVKENDNIHGLRNDVRDLSGKVGALTVENERLKQMSTAAKDSNAELEALKNKLAIAEADILAHKAKSEELTTANVRLQANVADNTAAAENASLANAALADIKTQLSETSIEAGNLRLRLEQAAADHKIALDNVLAENELLKAQLETLAPKESSAKMSFATGITNDLKIIEGIGPKIEELFHAAGINTFKQLYDIPADNLRLILNNAGPNFQIHDPGTWGEQARLADEGKWEELKALQDRLKAGKDS